MKNDEATQDGGNCLGKEVDITSMAAQFYSALYRFAVSLTRSETDAADLVQKTFLVLTRRSHQIRDFSQIKCWLIYDAPSGVLTNNQLQKEIFRSGVPA